MHDRESLPGGGFLIINNDMRFWKKSNKTPFNTKPLRSATGVVGSRGAPAVKFRARSREQFACSTIRGTGIIFMPALRTSVSSTSMYTTIRVLGFMLATHVAWRKSSLILSAIATSADGSYFVATPVNGHVPTAGVIRLSVAADCIRISEIRTPERGSGPVGPLIAIATRGTES